MGVCFLSSHHGSAPVQRDKVQVITTDEGDVRPGQGSHLVIPVSKLRGTRMLARVRAPLQSPSDRTGTLNDVIAEEVRRRQESLASQLLVWRS